MLYKKIIKEYYHPPGTLCMNTSLATRLFEYIKETPTLTDVDIHRLVESAIAWNEKYDVLNMDAYQSLISGAAVPAY